MTNAVHLSPARTVKRRSLHGNVVQTVTVAAFLELESVMSWRIGLTGWRISPKLPDYETSIPQVLIDRAMARVSHIYEASEILRRVTAAGSVTTFFLASVKTLPGSCRIGSLGP